MSQWEIDFPPSCIEELCLPPSYSKRLLRYERTGNFPNLIFYGDTGLGKTTTANILSNLDGKDEYQVPCGVVQTRTDMNKALRGTTSVVLDGKQRVVVLDEFHNVGEPAQGALIEPLERKDSPNAFIIVTNKYEKITAPIKSRCVSLCFDIGYVDENKKSQTYGEWVPYSNTEMTTDEWKEELYRMGRILGSKAGYKITDEMLNHASRDAAKLGDVRNFIQSLQDIAQETYD
jgi:DNA polymerase III delta prime subunit